MHIAKRTAFTFVITLIIAFLSIFSLGLSIELMQSPGIERRFTGFWSDELYCKVHLFYSLIVFFVLNEYVLLRDTALKRNFAEASEKQGFFGRCLFALNQYEMWLGFAILASFFVAFPNAPIRNELDGGFGLSMAGIPITLALVFILRYAAYIFTLTHWARMTKRQLKAELSKSVTFKTRIKQSLVLLLLSIPLTLGGMALGFVYPMLSTILSILKIGWVPFLIIAAVVIFALYFCRYLRAIILRLKLLKGIKSVCMEKGYGVTVKNAILSLFFHRRGYNIEIAAGKKRYLCRLIGILYKMDPLYFDDDGYASYDKHRVFWRHIVSEKYTFEADEADKKILLVCPLPCYVYAKTATQEFALDYGDRVWDYTFYNTSGFLNDLKYDCVR